MGITAGLCVWRTEEQGRREEAVVLKSTLLVQDDGIWFGECEYGKEVVIDFIS